MPIYESECTKCGREHEYLRDVKDYLDTPGCCGTRTKKVIRSAPIGYIAGNFDAFRSSIDGSVIANARDLKAHNERNGVVSMSDGYSTEQLSRLEKKSTVASNTADIVADMGESIQMLNQGYKPQMEMHDGY